MPHTDMMVLASARLKPLCRQGGTALPQPMLPIGSMSRSPLRTPALAKAQAVSTCVQSCVHPDLPSQKSPSTRKKDASYLSFAHCPKEGIAPFPGLRDRTMLLLALRTEDAISSSSSATRSFAKRQSHLSSSTPLSTASSTTESYQAYAAGWLAFTPSCRVLQEQLRSNRAMSAAVYCSMPLIGVRSTTDRTGMPRINQWPKLKPYYLSSAVSGAKLPLQDGNRSELGTRRPYLSIETSIGSKDAEDAYQPASLVIQVYCLSNKPDDFKNFPACRINVSFPSSPTASHEFHPRTVP